MRPSPCSMAGRKCSSQISEISQMDYETPEVLASYSEDELTQDAAVAMDYGNGVIVVPT